ncbi:MAG: MATE family efflux transporter, partial [bacterium]
AILIGAIGTAVMFLFSNSFLITLNLEGTFLAFGRTYVLIVASGFILQAVAFSMSQIIFSHGYTKVGMMASLVANIVNLILNYVLIFGVEGLGIPSLGVAGAAISVLVSRIVYFLLLAIFLSRSIDVTVSFHIFRPFPKQILRDILRIGLPSSGENISYTGSQLIITSFVAAIGAIAITTKTYYETLAMFSWAVSASVAAATTIMVGHLTGAGDPDECDRVVRHSLKISLISTAVVMTIFVFTIGSLVRLFTDNPEIIRLAKIIVWIDVGLEMGRAVNMVVGTSLKSTGDVRYPFYVAVAVQWTVMIAGAYLLGIVAGLGLVGIWIAIAADEMIRSIVLFSRWASGKWRARALVKRALPSK